jgi:6-phosphofructokinase 2
MEKSQSIERNSGNIVTLSLNPAVDISYRVKQLIESDKCNSEVSRYDPGGNGINVSRSFKLLGVEAYTCCVLAGDSGELLRNLLNQQVDHLEVLDIPGSTRINCSIHQLRPPQEFKIAGVGPVLSSDQVLEISKRFVELSKNGIGILTGSLPPEIDASIYTDLGSQLHDNGAKVVIDAKSKILAETLSIKPYLIKPNQQELERLAGKTLTSVSALAERTRELQRQGVQNICVSLGKEGAIFTNKNNSYYAKAPRINPLCSTGAGDSMLAGILVGLIQNKTAEDILRLGIACGSCTVTREGTLLFDPETLPALMDMIEVTQLDI